MWVKSILLLQKMTSCCQTCHPNILATWQWPAPESEKLGWANNGCNFNEQSGIWEAQDGPFVLLSSLANSIFLIFTLFHPPWCVNKIIQIINKHRWGGFYKTVKKNNSLPSMSNLSGPYFWKTYFCSQMPQTSTLWTFQTPAAGLHSFATILGLSICSCYCFYVL